MSEKKPVVVMTTSGRAKEHPPGTTIQEVLAAIYREYLPPGSDWDRPAKLFIGGECIVSSELADIAFEYGCFQEEKYEELDAAMEEWVQKRFGGRLGSEVA